MKCYRCHKTRHFKKDCLLQKKGGEERDSISTVTEGLKMDDLLIVLEEPVGCDVSEMASKGSIKSRESEGAVMECKAQLEHR